MNAIGRVCVAACMSIGPAFAGTDPAISLPDAEIVDAYERAAGRNVLAAVNPDIFFGYWSVCADGIGHGHGNTFPALDGHQMADALLHLNQIDVVKANWDYVESFQRPDGQLPFAILPASAGQAIGPPDSQAHVDPNGGLYAHWVKNNPLRALGYTTYIQNADVLYRFTQDRAWLDQHLPSVNRAGNYLATLMADNGAVGGAGYYVERPTRVEFDGVTQGYAMDAFLRLAALNALAGNTDEAQSFEALAGRVRVCFQNTFWQGDRFAEYIHPERGAVATHGYTDADWTGIATGIATKDQMAILWPNIRNNPAFLYGGVPTAIATAPDRYEPWEFAYDDRMDLAAMGRVWYTECWARHRMGDAEGLVESIRRVCRVGKEGGYYWRERYGTEGGFGVEKYCEYPANLVRVLYRFLLGVEIELDGSLTVAPCVPDSFWNTGFGCQRIWRGNVLSLTFHNGEIAGTFSGDREQRLILGLPGTVGTSAIEVRVNDKPMTNNAKPGMIGLALPPARADVPARFSVTWQLQPAPLP